MKSKHNLQSGFTLIEALLLILILAIIGLGGYYVWRNQQSDEKKPFAATSKSQQNTPSKSTSQAVQYFTIKEWGVRAKYSGTLTLKYTLDTTGTPQFAKFSSSQLEAADPQCSEEYGGIVQRYLASDHYLVGDDGEDSGQTVAQFVKTLDPGQYGHAGNYYYIYKHPQAACSPSQSAQDLQGQTQDAVKDLVSHLEANAT